MADYAITGKKGAGKSLFAVGLIRDALRAGKQVATNLDVHLSHLMNPTNKATYLRIPDRPDITDFIALGRGQAGVVEDDNGLIILDETSTFFGARQFQDKGRQPMLDWLIHSRKYGWDVYYIMQGIGQVDKLIRDTQIEYHVSVKRTDKWPIPIITPLARMVGLKVQFPKMHLGIIKHGVDANALRLETKFYRGKELYPCYDTQQIFLDREHPAAVGLHSRLSAFHTKGRYLGWWAMSKPILIAGIMLGSAVGIAAGSYGGYEFAASKNKTSVAIPYDKDTKITGYITRSDGYFALMSDGRMLPASGKYSDSGVDYLLISGQWVKP